MRNPKPKWFGELAVAIAGLSVFVWMAGAVMSGRSEAFDRAVRGWIHAGSFPALTYTMRAFTELGEAVFLVALGLLIVWRLVLGGRRREAVFFAIAALGAEALDQALKYGFRRPRPEAFFGVAPTNYSFPSGHALVSFCYYLVLAEMFIEQKWPRRRKFLTRAVAVALAGLIGLSRIYLGVHYPTDVLAGFAAAIAWLAMVQLVHKVRREA